MFGNYCRLPVFLPRKNKLQSNQKSRLFFQTDKFFWTDFLLLSTNFLIDWFRQLTGKHLFYRLFPGNKAIYVTGRLCDLNEKNGAEQTNYIGKYNEKHNEHAKPSVRDWHEKMNKKKFSEAICFRAVSWQATVTSTHSTILERNVTLFFSLFIDISLALLFDVSVNAVWPYRSPSFQSLTESLYFQSNVPKNATIIDNFLPKNLWEHSTRRVSIFNFNLRVSDYQSFGQHNNIIYALQFYAHAEYTKVRE